MLDIATTQNVKHNVKFKQALCKILLFYTEHNCWRPLEKVNHLFLWKQQQIFMSFCTDFFTINIFFAWMYLVESRWWLLQISFNPSNHNFRKYFTVNSKVKPSLTCVYEKTCWRRLTSCLLPFKLKFSKLLV